MQDKSDNESTTHAGIIVRKASVVPGNVRERPPFGAPRRNYEDSLLHLYEDTLKSITQL